MIPEQTVYATLVISVVVLYFFIVNLLEGKTKPNLVTWFFWSLAPILGTYLQIKAGAGLSVLPVFFAGFFPLIIFFIALFNKNSYWKITQFDIFCGIFCSAALLLWLITKNTSLSLFFAILADALAAVPTLIKSWKFPDTEFAYGYAPGIINNIIGLLIIKNWNFSVYSFGIYFIVLNSILILIIKRKEITSIFSRIYEQV